MIQELENKLKISENTAIHCPTLELAKQVLKIFNDLGLKWNTSRSYIEDHNWYSYKNNTTYYPFDGMFSYLQFAKDKNYKIIHAKEFIALHTKEKKFDLENYIPKRQLEGFPKEIIKRMLECQEEQGNKRNISIFENNTAAVKKAGGFLWSETYENFSFWCNVIHNKNFNVFFEKYPKICHKEENNIILLNTIFIQPRIDFNTSEDKNQDFKLGDKVYDIMCKSSGVITNVSMGRVEYPLTVDLENGKINTYTIDGRVNSYYKNPHLLHYRDNYDYTTIDFKNLLKRWRAEKGEYYYFIKRDEHNSNLDKILFLLMLYLL